MIPRPLRDGQGNARIEKTTGSRLDPIVYPLLVNYIFLLKTASVRDLYEAVIAPTPETARVYVFMATVVGSIVLPGISIGAYAIWLIGERKVVPGWSGWRLLTFFIATAAVVAQCELSREWTGESPLERWWSLTLLFGKLLSPAIELLVPLIMLAIAAWWLISRGRRRTVVGRIDQQ